MKILLKFLSISLFLFSALSQADFEGEFAYCAAAQAACSGAAGYQCSPFSTRPRIRYLYNESYYCTPGSDENNQDCPDGSAPATGGSCKRDSDGDGDPDETDPEPGNPDKNSSNSGGGGGDNGEPGANGQPPDVTDDNNDGKQDGSSSDSASDPDGDGVPNIDDSDDDGDGIPDAQDKHPYTTQRSWDYLQPGDDDRPWVIDEEGNVWENTTGASCSKQLKICVGGYEKTGWTTEDMGWDIEEGNAKYDPAAAARKDQAAGENNSTGHSEDLGSKTTSTNTENHSDGGSTTTTTKKDLKSNGEKTTTKTTTKTNPDGSKSVTKNSKTSSPNGTTTTTTTTTDFDSSGAETGTTVNSQGSRNTTSGDDGEDEYEGDSYSGGGTCSAPPACSGKSQVECGIVNQLWLNRCGPENKGKGSGSCDIPPTCTEGSLTCELLKQEHTFNCDIEEVELSDFKEKFTSDGLKEDSFLTDNFLKKERELDGASDAADALSGLFPSGIGGKSISGQCIDIPDISYKGSSIGFDVSSICTALGWISSLLYLAAYLSAFTIMFRAITEG